MLQMAGGWASIERHLEAGRRLCVHAGVQDEAEREPMITATTVVAAQLTYICLIGISKKQLEVKNC